MSPGWPNQPLGGAVRTSMPLPSAVDMVPAMSWAKRIANRYPSCRSRAAPAWQKTPTDPLKYMAIRTMTLWGMAFSPAAITDILTTSEYEDCDGQETQNPCRC